MQTFWGKITQTKAKPPFGGITRHSFKSKHELVLRKEEAVELGTPLSSRTEAHPSGTETGKSGTQGLRDNSLFMSKGSRDPSLGSCHFRFHGSFNPTHWGFKSRSITRQTESFAEHLRRAPRQSCEREGEKIRTAKKRRTPMHSRPRRPDQLPSLAVPTPRRPAEILSKVQDGFLTPTRRPSAPFFGLEEPAHLRHIDFEGVLRLSPTSSFPGLLGIESHSLGFRCLGNNRDISKDFLEDSRRKSEEHYAELCDSSKHLKLWGRGREELTLCQEYCFPAENTGHLGQAEIDRENTKNTPANEVTRHVLEAINSDEEMLSKKEELFQGINTCCEICKCYMFNQGNEPEDSCCPGKGAPRGNKAGQWKKQDKNHQCSFCKKFCTEACHDFKDFYKINLQVIKHRIFHGDHIDFLLDGNLLHFKQEEFYFHGKVRLIS